MVLSAGMAHTKIRKPIIERINPGVLSSKERILNFIQRRFPQNCDSNWLTGNCLWFAYILQKRFPDLEIFYLPIEGHFIAGLPQENLYFD